jgi:Tfp pilus assembly protein FimV
MPDDPAQSPRTGKESLMRLLIGSIAAMLLAGCATPPSAPETSAPAPVATTAAVATPARAVAPAAEPVAVQAETKSYPGYKKKTRDGQTVYCKKVAKIGSRFEEETCMTGQEMEALAERAEQDRQEFRRNSTICGTGGCGGN